MIDLKRINREWITGVAKSYQADPLLIEKVNRAFLLLEGLVKQSIPFVFKGGTALMLHFKSSKRLSIDIDILVSEVEKTLELLLTQLVTQQGFTRYQEQNREDTSSIKKRHFKFFFQSVYSLSSKEEYVMLDVLFESVHYTTLEKRPIQSPFVPQTNSPLEVVVPSAEDLLGDKLTAFAPNTTGIPYHKGGRSMSMEIIKQLYDIGCLFDMVEDLATVRHTFNAFSSTELRYRALQHNSSDVVLNDLFETAYTMVSRGQQKKDDFAALQEGTKRIRDYIFSEKYVIEDAINHASKVLYLTQCMRSNRSRLDRYKDTIDMTSWAIQSPLSKKLNKLKKSDPEAFYYCYQTYQLLKDSPI